MRYRILAVPFTISEGVTWRVDPDGPDHCRVSAHVSARFPTGPVGRLLWILFTRVLDDINKDRRHARTELEYLNAIWAGTDRENPPTAAEDHPHA